MLRILAHFFSTLFHPLLMPTYLFLLLFWLHPYQFTAISFDTKVQLLAMISLNTLILPMLIIYLMKQLYVISSVTLYKQKDRIYPFIAITLLFGLVYYRLQTLPFPAMLEVSVLAITIAVATGFLVNFATKVSMHCVGISGVAGILLATAPQSSYDMMLPLSILIIGAGLTGTSRLILKVHHKNEVYLGYLLGLFSTILTFYFAA
jgi:membrane-associated phospholipid phosphatase